MQRSSGFTLIRPHGVLPPTSKDEPGHTTNVAHLGHLFKPCPEYKNPSGARAEGEVAGVCLVVRLWQAYPSLKNRQDTIFMWALHLQDPPRSDVSARSQAREVPYVCQLMVA